MIEVFCKCLHTRSHFVDRWRFIIIIKAVSYRQEARKCNKKNKSHIPHERKSMGREFRLSQGVVLPSPCDNGLGLHLTPVTLDSGRSGC